MAITSVPAFYEAALPPDPIPVLISETELHSLSPQHLSLHEDVDTTHSRHVRVLPSTTTH